MSETRNCPKCGSILPRNAPAGLCPKCLMRAAMDGDHEPRESGDGSEVAATTPHAGGFVAPDPALLAPLFPQLEIIELLGQGGMGAVYQARQTKLDRQVALKIIRPESSDDPAFAERFKREARTLARLNHANIVSVHDFGEVTYVDPHGETATPRTLYYFLMEFVDGVNLRQLLEAGQLPPDKALAIVPQLCEALQFAHDEGVVHRDIKPENVLLDRKGRVKIADFGLAKLATLTEHDYRLTGTHQVMGTPQYMAPEQMEGSGAVDHRADIYSLGVVFYEMLTGQVPAGQFEPPSKKATIDLRLDDVILRSLAREPERRYQQASEVRTDVEAISQAPGTPPRHSPSWPQTDGSHAREESFVGPVDFVEAESDLNSPSVAMMVVGALMAAGHLLTIVACLISPFDRQTSPFGIPGLLVGLALCIGGVAMRQFRSRAWAQFGIIAGFIPAGPGWIISAPLSIWANSVLHRPEIRQAFVERARQRQTAVSKPPAASGSPGNHELVGAVTLTSIHFILIALLNFALLRVVPGYERVFVDFGVELPSILATVIHASKLVATYWYLIIPLVIIGLTLDFVILFVLGKLSRVLQAIVGICLVLAIVGSAGSVFLAIWVPLTSLVNKLS